MARSGSPLEPTSTPSARSLHRRRRARPTNAARRATVRALAKSSGWALLITSGQDLSSSDGKIDEIYAMARNIRPCIVFIDEADDILANRQISWNKSMTNKVLSVIDGAGGKSVGPGL